MARWDACLKAAPCFGLECAYRLRVIFYMCCFCPPNDCFRETEVMGAVARGWHTAVWWKPRPHCVARESQHDGCIPTPGPGCDDENGSKGHLNFKKKKSIVVTCLLTALCLTAKTLRRRAGHRRTQGDNRGFQNDGWWPSCLPLAVSSEGNAGAHAWPHTSLPGLARGFGASSTGGQSRSQGHLQAWLPERLGEG